jgi:hypothetical protein
VCRDAMPWGIYAYPFRGDFLEESIFIYANKGQTRGRPYGSICLNSLVFLMKNDRLKCCLTYATCRGRVNANDLRNYIF